MIRIKLASLIERAGIKHGDTPRLADVSKGTGIHRATLSKMLNQPGYNASFDSLDRLCTYFQVSVDQVIEHTDTPVIERTPDTFTVGGVDFTPVKRQHPRKPDTFMWLVQLNETGEVWEPGTGGVSNDSRPKMQADLEELFERGSKYDETDWRRSVGLPVKNR